MTDTTDRLHSRDPMRSLQRCETLVYPSNLLIPKDPSVGESKYKVTRPNDRTGNLKSFGGFTNITRRFKLWTTRTKPSSTSTDKPTRQTQGTQPTTPQWVSGLRGHPYDSGVEPATTVVSPREVDLDCLEGTNRRGVDDNTDEKLRPSTKYTGITRPDSPVLWCTFENNRQRSTDIDSETWN